MEIRDRVVVVTGGASGIGRALCVAFAAQGARGVVVADIDGDGATEVAAEIEASGGRATAVPTDVSREADVQQLVRRAEDTYGPVDLFCANAGILVSGGVEASDEVWQRMWGVNVQSHIYAARAVLPGMIARGEGYLLHTASAAGLLTSLGSAPYALTKHAVVALAEWLSITHAADGIKVSCLCPQAVWTKMSGARPSGRAGDAGRTGAAAASPAARDGIMEAEDVAGIVVAALREERFLILPHAEVATYEKRRADDRERWLTGMRRVQESLAPPALRGTTSGEVV